MSPDQLKVLQFEESRVDILGLIHGRRDLKTLRLAKIRKISLSRMVSDYFKSIPAQQKKEVIDSPILSEITGILPSKADNKKLLKTYKRHIEDKYL